MSINIGDPLPDFEVLVGGQPARSLIDYLGASGLILYFYPKDQTPGCTRQACDLASAWQMFQDAGWNILGVSPDSLDAHERFSKRHHLPFGLISDSSLQLAKFFDVWKNKRFMGREFLGIERSTFVFDGQGKMVKMYRKVSSSAHHELLSADLGVNLDA